MELFVRRSLSAAASPATVHIADVMLPNSHPEVRHHQVMLFSNVTLLSWWSEGANGLKFQGHSSETFMIQMLSGF